MNTPELELLGQVIFNDHLIPDFLSINDDVFQDQFVIGCRKAIKIFSTNETDINEYSILTWMVENSDYHESVIAEKLGDSIDTIGGENTYKTIKNHLYDINNKKRVNKVITDAALKIEHNEPIQNVLDFLVSKSIEISSLTGRKKSLVSIKEASILLFDKIEQASKGGANRIFTGLKKLDNYLGGIESPDVVYIAGRPSMGKTSLATIFLEHIAKSDKEKDNLIFTIETSNERIAEKIHIQRTKIPQYKFINGNLEQEEWDRLSFSASEIASFNNIMLCEKADITANDVLAECVKHQSKKPIGSFFVDYLQLLKSPPGQWSREREVAEQSRTMKIIAKKVDCPGFILSQLNRSLENRSDKIPGLSDLRDSGSIEQDADIILFIYRDEVYNPTDSKEPGKARIIIAKNKRGPTGYVTVGFDGKTSNFYNL